MPSATITPAAPAAPAIRPASRRPDVGAYEYGYGTSAPYGPVERPRTGRFDVGAYEYAAVGPGPGTGSLYEQIQDLLRQLMDLLNRLANT